MEKETLLRQLKQNLERARAWREKASLDFDAAIQAALTPDRHERLKSASREYTRALEAVNAALKEYNEYVLFRREPIALVEPEQAE